MSSWSLNIAAGAVATMSFEFMGKDEETKTSFPSLTALSENPYTARNFEIFLIDDAGTILKLTDATDVSITMNMNPDQYRVLGSDTIVEPVKGGFTLEASITTSLSSGNYALKTNYDNNDRMSLFIFAGHDENLPEDTTPYTFTLDISDLKFTDFATPVDSKNRLVQSMTLSAIDETILGKSYFNGSMAINVTDQNTQI